jgi:hypothetical protein
VGDVQVGVCEHMTTGMYINNLLVHTYSKSEVA